MKIDVIIPAYKAQDTMFRTLSSIACQTILQDLKITIVNDNDGIGYDKFVEMFKPYMDIQEIVMPENGGPGDARQFGIDNTNNPLVTFIDADDTFIGAFALQRLRDNILNEPTNACCFGTFLEEQPNMFIPHPQDTVWMFGKLYKREFINKYNIKFLKGSRANEDAGFNMLCKLCTTPNEQIKFIQDTIYFWHFKEDSITRINNCQYSYDQSFVGYTENMIYAFKQAEKINPFNPNVGMQKVAVLCNLYEYYMEAYARDKRFVDQNWNYCLKYYNEVYKEIEGKIPEKMLAEMYNECLRNAYAGNKLAGIIPVYGIKEFLEKLKADANKE